MGVPEAPWNVVVSTFWSKVAATGNVCECWIWTRASDPAGYGRVYTRASISGSGLAHRAAYEITFGPLGEGMTLDHLCRETSCVNPWHLEPVSLAENIRRCPRKTHCPQGHEFTPENTHIRKTGIGRDCLSCARIRTRAYNKRRSETC